MGKVTAVKFDDCSVIAGVVLFLRILTGDGAVLCAAGSAHDLASAISHSQDLPTHGGARLDPLSIPVL